MASASKDQPTRGRDSSHDGSAHLPSEQAAAFASLVEDSDDFIALIDSEARLLYVNAAFRKIVGLGAQESLAERSLAEFLPLEAARSLNDVELPAVVATGRWTGESQMRFWKTGCTVDVAVTSYAVEEDGRPVCIATVRRDISDRKRAAELSRASEERFRQLAENIDEVFWISEFDPRKIVYVSPAYPRMFGSSIEKLYADANSFMENIHPDDFSRIAASLPKARAGGYDESYRIVHPDGSIRVIRSRAFPIRNERGEVYRVAGIAEDITQTREFEQELIAEQRFLEHLLHVHEGERKLVAYDIHDGFVQSVIAAVMHLESLTDAGAADTSTQEKLELSVKLLREAIEEARRLIGGLRPPVLDDEGLVPAIEYLVREASGQATRIEFHHAVQFNRLDPALEGALFRIVQEALANVFRHSQAHSARVSLEQHEVRLTLTVEDDGVGFDMRHVGPRQFGLRGIRERARLCGGTATIDSKPSAGTRIRVQMPLNDALGQGATS